MTGREAIDEARRVRCGFLREEDIKAIAADSETRLTLILVRCDGGRFLAPAQDVEHFDKIISQTIPTLRADQWETDYVRDVSLPADYKIEPGPPAPLTRKTVHNGPEIGKPTVLEIACQHNNVSEYFQKCDDCGADLSAQLAGVGVCLDCGAKGGEACEPTCPQVTDSGIQERSK